MAVIDNHACHRYELEIDGQVVFSDYRRDGDVVALTHVEAPVELRGTGAAGRLMDGIMRIAEDEKLKIRPVCSYAVAWMQRHPAFHYLLP